ncbi:MAG: tetratricopeptide repeat protein [Pirellulaceae bacterium]|nr:tetratricopeptide repeat protein [Pirellulaceae bacterium]
MSTDQPTPEPDLPSIESFSLWGRMKTRARRLLATGRELVRPTRKRILIGVGVALPLIVGALVIRNLPRAPSYDVVGQTNVALEYLDAGDLEEAAAKAEQLREHKAFSREQLGGPVFVLGAVKSIEAGQQASESEKKKKYHLASLYLEEAIERGVPPGRLGQALFLLGKSTALAGKPEMAVPRLLAAIEKSPQHARELHRLVTDAYLAMDPPELDLALQHNQHLLADDLLPPNERALVRLQQCRLLRMMGKETECLAELAKLDNPLVIADALVLRARLVIDGVDAAQRGGATIDEIRPAIDAALLLLRDERIQLQPRKSAAPRTASYLIGSCYRRLQDWPAAQRQFDRTRRDFFNTDEGLAASFEEAEAERKIGDRMDALRGYLRFLSNAPDPASYHNRWLPLDDLRTRLDDIFLDYHSGQDHDLAYRLAQSISPIHSETRAVELQAESQRAWAKKLEDDARPLPISQAEAKLLEAREHWRLAGDGFETLAELRYATEGHTAALWESAVCYLKGREHHKTVSKIDLLIETGNVANRPLVLAARGEALLSLNQLDKAIEAFGVCIRRFPKSQESYRARLLLSRAHLEQGDLKAAKAPLLENMESDLTPASKIWQETLFDLGELHYLEGTRYMAQSRVDGLTHADANTPPNRQALQNVQDAHTSYGKTIRWLGEAVARWPNHRDSLYARYLLARAHHHRSRLPYHRLPYEKIETSRDQLREQMRNSLDKAHRRYSELLTMLDKRNDDTELSESESAMLRNCYFAQADALFELGKWAEAADAYSSASSQYQHRPESLEAFVQIAACHRRMDNHQQARGTLEQAKVVLQRLPPDADFKTTTTRGSAKA